MIVLDKRLEVGLEELVKEHCEASRSRRVAATAGVLVGSRDGADLLVAHVAKCPLPDAADDDDDGGAAPTRDTAMRAAPLRPPDECLDAEWVAEHGRHVLRSLPGGVDVLGALLLCDKRLSSAMQTTMLRAVRLLARRCAAASLAPAPTVAPAMVLVYQEVPLGTPSAVMVDFSKGGGQTYSTRVVFQPLRWHSLRCRIALDANLAVEDLSAVDNLQQFVGALQSVASQISNSVCSFDGSILPDGEVLFPKASRKDVGGRTKSVTVDMFLGGGAEKDGDDARVTTSGERLVLKAAVECRGAVVAGANAAAATSAIRADLLRSLYARLELHCESMQVVEDEGRDAAAVHQLPRRAVVALPGHADVAVSDYLFEADGAADAVETFRDVLAIRVDEGSLVGRGVAAQWSLAADVHDELETAVDEESLCELGLALPELESASSSRRLSSASSDSSAVDSRLSARWRNLLYICAALFVALVAVVLFRVLSS